ncbi:hypothetical protein C8J57DRAFT_1486634 [Mycena rebaudengoi]|nr:hypothetical protein C8J57DRAFT_1486634 [Mycena rebaudengoi]
MPQQQYCFWCLDPATCRNISVGLDPGTQISIASGAWNQLPSECMDPDTRKNIRGSGNQKQYSGRYLDPDTCSNISAVPGVILPQEYYCGVGIQLPAAVFLLNVHTQLPAEPYAR